MRDEILNQNGETFATDCDRIFINEERKRKSEYPETMKIIMARLLAEHQLKVDEAELLARMEEEEQREQESVEKGNS